ncbi:hypothetical protein GcM3_026009 [Golovinomyces cichoracearum]|uniref:Uncharacterized protein n=1 Tax=Golovinomyces cichoracearum TaxID=62708 RepID=A0A420J6B1_9PEZI|nr:hypothetical protein GcM3_026009 [Golovinomyces cichoracearum]
MDEHNCNTTSRYNQYLNSLLVGFFMVCMAGIMFMSERGLNCLIISKKKSVIITGITEQSFEKSPFKSLEHASYLSFESMIQRAAYSQLK